MKLNLVSISVLTLLFASSSFATTPVQPQPAVPGQQVQQVEQPQSQGQVQGQPQPQGQAQGNTAPVPAKKKIDPNLAKKLAVKVDEVSEEEYQKIVGEYKRYLRDVPAVVRQEIRDYRKEVVRINKEKSALYKKLSQEGQKFLAKEREIKRKLPIHNQAAFAKEIRHSEAE